MRNKTQLAAESANFCAQLSAFLLQVRERAVSQFEYNLAQNVPSGILKLDACAAHAVTHGIVAAISARNEFGIIETMELCGDLLEDVNAHTEAKMIRDLATKEAAAL